MVLTLQFVPYNDIDGLGSARRVKKLIDIVKENKIVLLEGRLKKEEEADLISIAMEEIGRKFRGIELAVIDPKKKQGNLLKGVKSGKTEGESESTCDFIKMIRGAARTDFSIQPAI